jgi:hypothetical protein
MRSLLLILMLVTVGSADAQHLSMKTRLKVKRIRIVNNLHDSQVGFAGHESGQYRAFVWLSGHASTEELLRLSRHRNGVVRAYAGWALADRKYPRLDEVFLSFLLKPGEISKTGGCIVTGSTVAYEFYQRTYFAGWKYDQDSLRSFREADSLFYTGQRRRMDSILFTQPHLMNSAPEFLNTNFLDTVFPANYEKIKDMAVKERYYSVIEALVMYRKPEDLSLIIGLEDFSLSIIEKVHDPVYWPTLKEYATNDALKYLSVIASYKNAEALDFLSAVSDTLHHSYHLRLLAEALQRNFTGIYSELLSRMKKNYESALQLESVYMPEKLRSRMEKMDAYIKKNVKHRETRCSYEIVDGKTIIKYSLLGTRFKNLQSGVDELFTRLIREIPDLCETDEIHFSFENRSTYAGGVYKNCGKYR